MKFKHTFKTIKIFPTFKIKTAIYLKTVMKKPAIDYWSYLTKVRIKRKFSNQEIYAVLLLLLWLLVFLLKN
jgi:hypothetical protein